jgi:hypothetical protein
MEDKEKSTSKLEALLERVPVLDGGGRRRLTAGTIVVITAVSTLDYFKADVSQTVSSKDVSVSLLLASGVLLIFATGVLVELVGEVFLARAVANVVWSYAELSDQTAQWSHARRKMLAGAYIAFLGTLRAPFYFAFGLFGGSKQTSQVR